MNTELLAKIKSVKDELTETYGEFGFFALAEREDYLEHWEILTAAAWIKSDDYELLDAFVAALQGKLTETEFLAISGVVLLDARGEFIGAVEKKVTTVITTKGDHIEMINCNVNGLHVSHMYILASNRKALTANTRAKYQPRSSYFKPRELAKT